MASMRKPTLFVLFLIVFVDLVGFGIVLPLLPLYSEKLGASGVRNSLWNELDLGRAGVFEM